MLDICEYHIVATPLLGSVETFDLKKKNVYILLFSLHFLPNNILDK